MPADLVIVTGVAGGIGTATAKLFSEAGWDVTGVDRRRPSDESALACFVQADVSDPADWPKVTTCVAEQAGRLRAVVNNAAIQVLTPLTAMEPDEWDRVMATNVRSAYLAIRETYPLMRDEGGSIVNVSSVHALATSAGIAAYAASKGALLALTRAVAIELAPARIRVNSVVPGAVDTPMLHAGLRRDSGDERPIGELLDALAKKTAIGRVGDPEDIARAILFLADDESASFITGQGLVVDGGAIARLSTE